MIFSDKTKIIAELGTLHFHDWRSLYQATEDCFVFGADMVKVQLIDEVSAWWASPEQRERYKSFAVKGNDFEEYFNVFNFKDNKEIVFASIFDESFLSLNYCMPIWKLGYKAVHMPKLAEKVAKTQKPVIFSVSDDIYSEIIRKELLGYKNILYQYVQPEYPIDDKRVRIPLFCAKQFIGLSVHSKKFRVFESAMIMGAKTLEVHVQGEGAKGPDTSFALTLKELEKLAKLRDKVFLDHNFSVECNDYSI